MNTTVNPFNNYFSTDQLHFLKEARLPTISCLQIEEKELFLAFEAFKEIDLSYLSQAWTNKSEVLKINKGKILHLAKVEGKNRNVRLIYEENDDNYNLFISWNEYLRLKRKGYIVAYDVYQH